MFVTGSGVGGGGVHCASAGCDAPRDKGTSADAAISQNFRRVTPDGTTNDRRQPPMTPPFACRRPACPPMRCLAVPATTADYHTRRVAAVPTVGNCRL